jgi:hypothetical protein
MWRPPLGWYDIVIIWTSTAIAIGCAQAAIGERSILQQLIERWGRFGGLLRFVPVYIASPVTLLYNVTLGRGRAREMAWHVLRSMILIYSIVGLLLFFIWQAQQ